MTRTLRAATVAMILGWVLVAVGCGASGDPPGSGSNTAPGPRPASTGVLTIVEPRDGQIVRDDQVDLAIDLEGANLVDLTSTDVRPDEGHLHLVLDDELVSMTAALDQTLTDLRPGLHLLKVEFVAADHAPFDPRVIAAVGFTVRER